jgi:tRNA threonylcarbamoyladenosine biosynthesis protein TsaB
MHDAWLLALETSSRHGSVALGRGPDVMAYRPLSADRRHTTELLPVVRELLTEVGCRPRDVGVVCFSQGPGSFTGLRVAATLARMWQSAIGSRVLACRRWRRSRAMCFAGRMSRGGSSCCATPARAVCLARCMNAPPGRQNPPPAPPWPGGGVRLAPPW